MPSPPPPLQKVRHFKVQSLNPEKFHPVGRKMVFLHEIGLKVDQNGPKLDQRGLQKRLK